MALTITKPPLIRVSAPTTPKKVRTSYHDAPPYIPSGNPTYQSYKEFNKYIATVYSTEEKPPRFVMSLGAVFAHSFKEAVAKAKVLYPCKTGEYVEVYQTQQI